MASDLDLAAAEFLSQGVSLKRYLSRMVGVEASDELLQETFARVLEYSRIVRPSPALLFHIARNLARNHKARAAVQRLHIVEPPAGFQPSANQPSPERVVEDRDELRLLSDALDRLPPRRRAMFVLARVHASPTRRSVRGWA